MPLIATRGAASAQGFGEFAQATAANYIEDVFSCFLYTGNGSTQTITNGINLSTKGGLVWIKGRSGATGHRLTDTVRGVTKSLASETTAAEATETTGLTAFGTTGFTIGADADYNTSSATYVSWTFREQAKFFDVVTWTGTGSNRTIAHALGSVPGCIIVKRTDTTADWAVYHRSLANTQYLVLNTTAAAATGATWWNSTTPTSSVFSVGTDASVNASGGTYVAYIFAHDAGGFGLTGTDNVISCGSFAAAGALTYVPLGYEPQWVLVKSVSGADPVQNWYTIDTMRGMSLTGTTKLLPNTSAVESNPAAGNPEYPAATGMYLWPPGSGTYIYIAIRRGPMAVPTLGTSVFSPVTYTGTGANITLSSGGFAPDLLFSKIRSLGYSTEVWDKLRGVTQILNTAFTYAESTGTANNDLVSLNNTSLTAGPPVYSTMNISTYAYVNYMFGRAPSFFDEVCYTGTGVARTISHNLAAVPELMIFKSRSDVRNWIVYSSTLGATKNLRLNAADGEDTNTYWNNTTPTASVFSIDGSIVVNANTSTFVAYLFATCAGVSKVGSYTGTGTTLQVNCGFTAGARFVLIKRTDTTGDWYVWDSARGIIAGNDPYLLLNSTAAEVAGTDYVDTYSAGFEISSTAPAAINASAGTFIFLAIA